MPAARNREEFIAECRSGALDGVRAAYRIFSSAAVTGLIDEELVQALPQSLRFICHNGVFASPLPYLFHPSLHPHLLSLTPPFSSHVPLISSLSPPLYIESRNPDTDTSHPHTHTH